MSVRGKNGARVPVLLLLWVFFLLADLQAQAKPRFSASEISGPSTELLVADLDGDGLTDLVLLDDLKVSVFYQDPQHGFPRAPQQTWRLEHRPCLVWAAKLGGSADCLLVMTSDGVTELGFTNRSGPPVARGIIRQPTVVPTAARGTNALWLPLSAATGGDWPLLLVPATDGLQVWQHRGEWRRAQVLHPAMEARLRPSTENPGYSAAYGLDLSVGDVIGDGRDDLMINCREVPETNTYRLYLQQTNGLFASEPAFTHAERVDQDVWLGWTDINRDGHLDLIKSAWLEEPSFLPGQTSGKVLVGVYLADGQGRIPAQPQAVFRKNDWMPALPVLDVDGDGYPDLVLGYSVLDTREGMKKEITAKQLDYNLRFYFYRPGTGFPQTADCQRNVVIHMDESELLLSWGRSQYFGRYVSLGGDFNGDGKTDLLVRDHWDQISVYDFVSREQGFRSEPDQQFNCPDPIEEWRVADLNRDGVSDLIVRLAHQKGYRIFMSQK
jgi:hypothetical protein